MQEELTINPQTNKPSFYRSKEFGFFLDNFILKSHDAINPMTTPAKTERNITIARDASNFQKRNEIATGIAFCTAKTVTTIMMINTIINVIIFFTFVFFHLHPFLKLNQQRIGGDNKATAEECVSDIRSIPVFSFRSKSEQYTIDW